MEVSIGFLHQICYRLSGIGFGYEFAANQLGKPENVSVIREYRLSMVSVRRESTVVLRLDGHDETS